jgi:predicted enzyme related to lactoylglutathione lyase
METANRPTFSNGKICYLETPSDDISSSANFYEIVFGWKIRSNNDNTLSFDDTIGEVSGMWVIGPKPASEIGIVISIMVDNIQATIDLVVEHGGKIIQMYEIGATEKIARFTDPFGNIFGLYQH